MQRYCHDRWSKEKFVSRFLENKNKVLAEAGLQVDAKEAKAVAAAKVAVEAAGQPVSCRICDDDFPLAGTES
jgi:hypothetical protein